MPAPDPWNSRGYERVSNRYTYGDRLAPNDAWEDRPHRRKHRRREFGEERRGHSADWGYHSDHEERRRRQEEDADREHRQRAHSSQRAEWEGYSNRESMARPSDDHYVNNVISSGSKQKPYDDHYVEDLLTREYSTSRRERSKLERYGEHHLEDPLHSYFPPPPPIFYGPESSAQDQVDPNLISIQRMMEDHYIHHKADPQPSSFHPVSPPPSDRADRMKRTSLPSGDHYPTDGVGNRKPQTGSHSPLTEPGQAPPELFPDVQPPRFSIFQHPPDPEKSLSNSVGPGDSRSEAGYDVERPRPRTAPSFASSGNRSPSPSGTASGILGPKSYQYMPLKEMEFRLVRILPERMWKLKCEIVHQSLRDAPNYIAISYAWGDGVDTKPLVLEGVTIPVAASLYDALKAVRRKKEEALVWVDALCIDQQNKNERATQVRLMGHIYSQAESVAIWLGPEADNSALAVELLLQVANNTVSAPRLRSLKNYEDSAALFELFKRDYWKRLWVVQEVLLAQKKLVYCGYSVFPWEVYQQAADAFWGPDSDPHIRQGPSSFPDRSSLLQLGDESLLEVLRMCRKKLSENPRDKVFGVLGMLPEATQREFPVDYSQSVKTVYTDVCDYLISTTDQLDVIREAIHFPVHVNSTGLPSWCPDWSHIPEVSGLGRTLNFAASRGKDGPTSAKYRFDDERRKLQISAVKLDIVRATGVAVGTFCASQDYLIAFLQWRAVLLHELQIHDDDETHPMHKAFCRTLSLGQIPEQQSELQLWHDLCYHIFSSLIRERMPRLPIDDTLLHYATVAGLIEPDARRKFLQDHFGNRMMGRSLCVTEQGLIGMGTGFMTAGDLIVVPFGCSTPILLRPNGRRDEYRYVGDVYVDGYMHGEAIEELIQVPPKRTEEKYLLC